MRLFLSLMIYFSSVFQNEYTTAKIGFFFNSTSVNSLDMADFNFWVNFLSDSEASVLCLPS